MHFLVIQTHIPENCPIDEPLGTDSYHLKTEEVKVLGIYRGGPNHEIYYLLETDSHEAIEKFLKPGFKKTESVVIPVTKMG